MNRRIWLESEDFQVQQIDICNNNRIFPTNHLLNYTPITPCCLYKLYVWFSPPFLTRSLCLQILLFYWKIQLLRCPSKPSYLKSVLNSQDDFDKINILKSLPIYYFKLYIYISGDFFHDINKSPSPTYLDVYMFICRWSGHNGSLVYNASLDPDVYLFICRWSGLCKLQVFYRFPYSL